MDAKPLFILLRLIIIRRRHVLGSPDKIPKSPCDNDVRFIRYKSYRISYNSYIIIYYQKDLLEFCRDYRECGVDEAMKLRFPQLEEDPWVCEDHDLFDLFFTLNLVEYNRIEKV